MIMVKGVGILLYEPAVSASFVQWMNESVLQQGMGDVLSQIIAQPVPEAESDRSGFARVAVEICENFLKEHQSTSTVFFIVALFWNGQSDHSKEAFIQLKQRAQSIGQDQQSASSSVDAGAAAKKTSSPLDAPIVQALNYKKGEQTMMDNKMALVSSLRKKVSAVLPATDEKATGNSNAKMPSTATAAAPPKGMSIGEADISVGAITAAVEEGQGECFFIISSPTEPLFQLRLAELKSNCAAAHVGCIPVLAQPRTVTLAGEHGGPPSTVIAQEMLLRRGIPGHHMELRLAMCGNVDSGKSTLTAVLTRGCRDDGRGFARAFVFNHKHEAMSGRTSSISENHLGFSSEGGVVNYECGSSVVRATGGHKGGDGSDPSTTTSTTTVRQYTPQELASRSAKVFTLYDLAGHERYLKTTVLGMTRNMPDYACIVISANNGIQRMTKEHLALCLALKLPCFIVVTRIDSTPANVYSETMANIRKLLKIPTVRKLPYPVQTPEEIVLAAKNVRHDRITPIFEVSNVNGTGVPALLHFLDLLPMRQDWRAARALPKQMIIDSTFFITGVGTVVGGIITQGVFHVNDTVVLGPDGFGHYRPVSIKSIHVKGVESAVAEAGNDAAFCLKKEKRSAIRKGNLLADPQHPPLSYWQFEAEVTILYHATTISVHYEPVIHSTTVRQSARITFVAQEVLRTGDRSIVRFHFLYRPEFMQVGQRLIFREGRTKGIGIVTQLTVAADEALTAKSKSGKSHMRLAPNASKVAGASAN